MARKRTGPQESAFVEDICAHPDDDAPRLVFADWLDEHDQALRGELIRLQCRLARMGDDDPDRPDLEGREWELLTVHGDEWAQALPAWARKEPFEFRRGLVGRVSLTATQFLGKGEGLVRVAPLEELHLRSASRLMKEVAAFPLLARLTGLDLSGNEMSGPTTGDLVRSPHLTRVRKFSLNNIRMPEECVAALATWPGLEGVRALNLAGDRLSSEMLHALLVAGRLREPHQLFLGHCYDRLTPAGVRLLADSPRLGRLTRLELQRCNLGREELASLASSKTLRSLRELNLADNDLGGGMTDLASSPLARQLTALTLDRCSLAAGDIGHLAGPRFAGLRRLRLTGNPVGDAGATALASSPHLAGLRALELNGCGIGPAGVAALAGSPHLTSLRSLDLGDNVIGGQGFQALASSSSLASLRKLGVVWTRFDHEDIVLLASSPTLGELRQLWAWNGAGIREESIRALATSPHLPRLLVLNPEYGRPPTELLRRYRDVRLTPTT